MNHPSTSVRNWRNQKGAVLFVALVFLLLLTLLAITSSGTAILQERMTGGMRNAQLAMMGTESALRAGEVDIWTVAQRSQLTSDAAGNVTGGGSALPPCAQRGSQPCVYARTNGVPDQRVTRFRTSQTWLGTNDGARAYTPVVTGLPNGASLASQPRYLIEDLGPDTAAVGAPQGRMGGGILQELGGPNGAPKTRLYRITARSQGGTDVLLRAAESVFGANFTNNQSNLVSGGGGP